MAHVTIENTPSYVRYDVTTSDDGPFVVPFAVFSEDDLVVEVDGEDIGGSFSYVATSSTTGGNQTGTVTLDDAVADAEVLIYRLISPVRTTDYAPGPLPVNAFNSAFDSFQAQLQDMRRDSNHAIRMPLGDGEIDPVRDGEEGQIIALGADGQPLWTDPADLGIDVALGSGWAGALAQDIDEVLDDLRGIRACATYAEMTALTSDELTDNALYCTYGRSAEEDGGFGFWRYDSASTATVDSGTILAKDVGGAGRFLRLYDTGDVRAEWFGALSSAFSATLALAITAAGIGGTIRVGRGNYSMSAGVTLLAQQSLIFENGVPFDEDYATAHVSSVTRAFNGSAFILTAAGCGIRGLNWDGVGATYTGTCVYIAGGQQQWLRDCDIDDNADACLEFVGADAGERFAADNCHFRRTTATNPAILMPTTVDTAGNRQFRHCSSYGGVMIRLNKSVNTHILECKFRNLDFAGSTSVGADLRCIIDSCRIATTGDDVTIEGGAVSLQGCTLAGNIVLGTSTGRCAIGPNAMVGFTVTDNSNATGANINEIWDAYASPSISWKALSVDPAIGNGSLSCRVQRQGRKLRIDVVLTAGSTTTFGTSSWYFVLPAPYNTWVAKAQAVGVGRILDSGTAYYAMVPVVAAAERNIFLFLDNSAAQVNPTAPMTWANGDTLTFSIEYEIS